MRLTLPAIGLALVATSLAATVPGAGSASAQTPDPNPGTYVVADMNDTSGAPRSSAPRSDECRGKTYATDVPQRSLASKAPSGIGVRSPDVSDRERATRARADFARGANASSRADRATSNAARLNLLDDAIVALKSARGHAYRSRSLEGIEMRCAIDAKLIDALDDQAEIYYARRALPTAMKRVNFALEVDPSDARSRELLSLIFAAESYGGGTYQGGSRTSGANR